MYFGQTVLLPLSPSLDLQVKDQSYGYPDNAALVRNCKSSTPVRVFRGQKAKNKGEYPVSTSPTALCARVCVSCSKPCCPPGLVLEMCVCFH